MGQEVCTSLVGRTLISGHGQGMRRWRYNRVCGVVCFAHASVFIHSCVCKLVREIANLDFYVISLTFNLYLHWDLNV